jgi:putative cell wall-binding protein
MSLFIGMRMEMLMIQTMLHLTNGADFSNKEISVIKDFNNMEISAIEELQDILGFMVI